MQAGKIQELARETLVAESRRQWREAQQQAEQAAQLARLKQARIDTHNERIALRRKFGHKDMAVEPRRAHRHQHRRRLNGSGPPRTRRRRLESPLATQMRLSPP